MWDDEDYDYEEEELWADDEGQDALLDAAADGEAEGFVTRVLEEKFLYLSGDEYVVVQKAVAAKLDGVEPDYDYDEHYDGEGGYPILLPAGDEREAALKAALAEARSVLVSLRKTRRSLPPPGQVVCRPLRRPLRSARRVRSVRRARAPGSSDDGPEPPPLAERRSTRRRFTALTEGRLG